MNASKTGSKANAPEQRYRKFPGAALSVGVLQHVILLSVMTAKVVNEAPLSGLSQSFSSEIVQEKQRGLNF